MFLVFDVCRRYGRALIGPPPDAVFPLVPRHQLLAAADNNLQIWESFSYFLMSEEAVLTACRAWHLASQGVLTGKIEAAQWASRHWNEPSVINDALARRSGENVSVSEPHARLLIKHVRQLLRDELAFRDQRNNGS